MLRKGIPSSLCASVLAMLVVASAVNSRTNSPVYAKRGVSFPAYCDADNLKECKALRIGSPDGKSAVEVSYSPLPDYPAIHSASLRVTTLGRDRGEVEVVSSVEDEIIWSPDSKAFFINGDADVDDGNMLAVHILDDPHLGPGNIAGAVMRDMVRSFPPCEAKDPVDICAELAAEPLGFIEVVGLDWIGNSSEMVVMGQVPCSSSMGGIMCQVLGYEIEVPGGKILRRMHSTEFARRWQHSMAWKFQDYGPPEFQSKLRSTPN
jgi:hypothetical protein